MHQKVEENASDVLTMDHRKLRVSDNITYVVNEEPLGICTSDGEERKKERRTTPYSLNR